jgi:hypothetical protein
MNAFKKNTHPAHIALGALSSLLVSGCELAPEATKAIHESLMDPPATLPSSGPVLSSPTPPPASCYVDQFQQPTEQISHSVDILFVADTSGSMAPKRAKVADALYAFVGALPAGTDYRIGVILAHSSTDPNVGKLYSSSGSIPKVLNSSTMSQSTIQNDLKQIMLAAPDYGNEEGEMGSYALLQALSPAKLSASRALGFFRPDAALAIVTISDENDICAVYPNPLPAGSSIPYQNYPSMPGMTASERNIRNRDCANGISTDQVINAVKNVQGDRPYVISAVIHPELNYYNINAGNDSYGWGYADVVNQSHGVLVNIGDASYISGLSQIGALTTSKLNLLSEFTLTHSNVEPLSMKVLVDRNSVAFEYNVNQNEVHLSDQLGGALSEIEVNYCEKQVTPSPTPTVTSSPSSSPTPTPSPSHSVTSSPSPSPSPSPTVTTSPSPSPTGCTGPFCGGSGTT